MLQSESFLYPFKGDEESITEPCSTDESEEDEPFTMSTNEGLRGRLNSSNDIEHGESTGLRERLPSGTDGDPAGIMRRRPSDTNQKWVSRVQTLRVPSFLNEEETYWISGIDEMIQTGRSAAEVVRIAGYRPPRYLFYMVSGAICDVVQISSLLVLHNFINNPTVCWCLGFLLSIPFRHTSHRYLVFGDYVGGYYQSLLRMYMGYSIIIVLSTLFNALLSSLAQTTMINWIVTLLWTGIANYFILKYCWKAN